VLLTVHPQWAKGPTLMPVNEDTHLTLGVRSVGDRGVLPWLQVVPVAHQGSGWLVLDATLAHSLEDALAPHLLKVVF
jgi:hypothetical protein